MDTKLEIKSENRREISKEKALEVLSESITMMFMAYFEAVEKFNIEIQQTIPEARSRLNAVLLNAKLTESFILKFPENWIKGKYGRIIFRWDEVQMLIKKLDKNGKPSYLPTLLSDKILNQTQSELFRDDADAKAEPILIFGYSKDKFGQIQSPRIVYYKDEVKWSINKEDLVLRPVSMDNLITRRAVESEVMKGKYVNRSVHLAENSACVTGRWKNTAIV